MPHYTCECGAKIGAESVSLLEQTIEAHKATCTGAYELAQALEFSKLALRSESPVELAAAQARELAREIGLDADDVAGLERAVRESAAEWRPCCSVCNAEAIDPTTQHCTKCGARWEGGEVDASRSMTLACGCKVVVPDAPTVQNAPTLQKAIEQHQAACRRGAPRITSVFDELELALRAGGILTLGAAAGVGTPGSIHAILETDDGGRFAQCKGPDVIGVLFELVAEWKDAKPKPPPLCLFCSAPLEGVLVGQHLNVGHTVPLCVAFGTERTRNSCVPPHAVQQLLAAELRKRKAAAQ